MTQRNISEIRYIPGSPCVHDPHSLSV
uniref:Uncharacterized protein n=1 Tax=Anguilla anguilla TaxID=7936 RepID=A0A0E9VGP9_ANGAN